jgi:hypothetical protein
MAAATPSRHRGKTRTLRGGGVQLSAVIRARRATKLLGQQTGQSDAGK